MKPAITPRLAIYAVVIASVVLISIFLGFVFKTRAQQRRKEATVQQQAASDAATSNRENQERSPTPISSLAAPPPPAQGSVSLGSNPVVDTLGQPVVNATTLNPTTPYTPPPYQPVLNAAPSPAEQALQNRVAAAQHRAEMERQAIEAPTGIRPPQAPQTQPVAATPYSELGSLAALMRPTTSGGEATLPSGQASSVDAKDAFVQESNPLEADNYLRAVRTAPKSRFELWQGTRIPATLEVKIQSENPGQITATVDRDVFDSVTGKYVLIPASAKLLGEYNAHTAYAQDRVQVVWTVLTFPDGSYLNLGRIGGYDAEGSSGLHDQTDHHWKRIIGGALLTSALSAGFQISQNRSNNNYVLGYPSTGQVAAGAVGQQMQQLGQEITSRNLATPPTINVRSGEQVDAFVSKRIVFEGPYQSMGAKQ